MLAGKEEATLVQVGNISAELWSTNLAVLHPFNAVTAPEGNNILKTIVFAMITFYWLTSGRVLVVTVLTATMSALYLHHENNHELWKPFAMILNPSSNANSPAIWF